MGNIPPVRSANDTGHINDHNLIQAILAAADAKGNILVASADDTWEVLVTGADGGFLVLDSTQPYGVKWLDSLPVQIGETYSVPGALSVSTGNTRFYVDYDGTLLPVRVALGTASASSDVVVNVLVNGSSVFTGGNEPTLTSGVNTVIVTPDTTAVTAGDYITVDITSVDSAARDLTVHVAYKS